MDKSNEGRSCDTHEVPKISETPTWVLFVSAVVWMSSASFINGFVAKDLPVWSLLCTNCKKRNHVASDGKTSFLLKYK